jgi:hypothetical protein
VKPEPSDEGLDGDVERMLRTYEGPENPVPRPHDRRARRPVIAALAGAVALVVVGIGAALIIGEGRVRPAALGTTQACRTLELAGREYRAREVPAGSISVRATTGRGTLHCGGTPRDVTASRIAGVDPRVAVARAGRVYVATGVCPGRSGGPLLVCLRSAPTTP